MRNYVMSFLAFACSLNGMSMKSSIHDVYQSDIPTWTQSSVYQRPTESYIYYNRMPNMLSAPHCDMTPQTSIANSNHISTVTITDPLIRQLVDLQVAGNKAAIKTMHTDLLNKLKTAWIGTKALETRLEKVKIILNDPATDFLDTIAHATYPESFVALQKMKMLGQEEVPTAAPLSYIRNGVDMVAAADKLFHDRFDASFEPINNNNQHPLNTSQETASLIVTQEAIETVDSNAQSAIIPQRLEASIDQPYDMMMSGAHSGTYKTVPNEKSLRNTGIPYPLTPWIYRVPVVGYTVKTLKNFGKDSVQRAHHIVTHPVQYVTSIGKGFYAVGKKVYSAGAALTRPRPTIEYLKQKLGRMPHPHEIIAHDYKRCKAAIGSALNSLRTARPREIQRFCAHFCVDSIIGVYTSRLVGRIGRLPVINKITRAIGSRTRKILRFDTSSITEESILADEVSAVKHNYTYDNRVTEIHSKNNKLMLDKIKIDYAK